MADNLLDKASILLTPTAYNDGSMLSVKAREWRWLRFHISVEVLLQLELTHMGLVENVQIMVSDAELVSNGKTFHSYF